MSKQAMSRSASDNEYMHKDFHGALSAGIDYLERNYGTDAVRDYLWRFTRSYYAPLIEEINRRGLSVLGEHFESIYAREDGVINIDMSENELFLNVETCPAVLHMLTHNYKVARLFIETERSVNSALCDGTPFDYELLEYDPQSGRSIQRFFRRP